MKVTIDSGSGFCGGVIRAIDTIEGLLAEGRTLYSLGEPVHNEEELARLSSLGLRVLDKAAFPDGVPAGAGLVIRAHGEPPQTYETAGKLGFNVIDCTCPVVLNIQKSIRQSYESLKSLPEPGQIVIFGKIGHAEVLGLVGQVDGDAIVVENLQQLKDLISAGTICTARDIEIFSQTTMSPVEYEEICDCLLHRMVSPDKLKIHRTICSQVASRHKDLADFARTHDIIIFVSGKTSSNGKVLCKLCKNVNIRTYHIGNTGELQRAWFHSGDKVGVCGATSTPKWLLEQTARDIENLQ